LVEIYEIPGLLGDSAAVGFAVMPTTWTLTGRDLHEELRVNPFEEHGVDSEEVAGQDRIGPGS
jgi:hypothetical protein